MGSREDAISALIKNPENWTQINRDSHPLLLLPQSGRAAKRALNLFQPQRFKAKALVAGLRAATFFELHRMPINNFHAHGNSTDWTPKLPSIKEGTCGFLIGSPDHQIQRMIASYETEHGWEVAKITWCKAGEDMLMNEANALRIIGDITPCSPRLHGLHKADHVTILRMPYLNGSKMRSSRKWDILGLLQSWKSKDAPIPMSQFQEWSSIINGINSAASIPKKECLITLLSRKSLVPTIRHGDLANWNVLRKPNGSLVVIDWEWSATNGIPGLDLVHCLAQEARLVKRQKPTSLVNGLITKLQSHKYKEYLQSVGWGEDIEMLILAGIAYPVGAGHQKNQDVLNVCVQRFS